MALERWTQSDTGAVSLLADPPLEGQTAHGIEHHRSSTIASNDADRRRSRRRAVTATAEHRADARAVRDAPAGHPGDLKRLAIDVKRIRR
jgi:hypothetical protein